MLRRFLDSHSAAILAICAIIAVAVHLFFRAGRHTLGHPLLVDISIFSMLAVLSVTHLAVTGIMWVQRGNWLPSEASMFRFVGIKSLFWSSQAWEYPWAGKGVTANNILFLIFMAVVTVDLDIKLFGRYILGWEDEEMLYKEEEDEDSPSEQRYVKRQIEV